MPRLITAEDRERGRLILQKTMGDPESAIDWSQIPPEHHASVKERLRYVPPKQLALYGRAVSGVAGRSQAIKATCLDCVGWVTRDVRECSAYGCPLHPVRPYQGSGKAEEDQENQQVTDTDQG